MYLTVLHRLCESGSDRAGESCRRDVLVLGSDGLKLHHLYRAMRWLGDSRAKVEEALVHHRRRDLFIECTLAFSTPPAFILRAGAGKAWGNSASPRTIGQTGAR